MVEIDDATVRQDNYVAAYMVIPRGTHAGYIFIGLVNSWKYAKHRTS